MKIKDAQKLTGLSQKTIRFYESEGLIHVKRNLNGYREYEEEDIETLRKIKILCKIDISISKIKEINENKVLLKDVLKDKLKKLDENELNMEIKRNTMEVILKEVNKNPNADITHFYEDFEYIESDEFNEFLGDIKEISNTSLATQILITIMLSGPFLWFFININNNKYDNIFMNGILLIVNTVILTLTWRSFLKQKDKKVKGTVSILLGIIFIFIITIFIFMGITSIQQMIFVPKNYLMFQFKEPYSYIVFFFEIEVLVIFIAKIYKYVKNVEWKWAHEVLSFAKRKFKLVIILNIILLYLCITGITVVTKTKIIDYSFYNPIGKTYSYYDISSVKAGFYGKSRRKTGEFYYIVTLKGDKKIDFYQSNSDLTDTYLELEIFDKLIMNTHKIKKESSRKNYELCDLDKKYVDRFLRIVENI